jgi:pimeloyl-ACP methyl ester carboxylesterase
MPRVLTDAQTLFYRLSANDLTHRRPPLLLIHGAGGTHMHWPAALRRLADWNVYALDLPGHGKSPGPGRDSIAAYCDVVYGVIQALGLERAVLAGHSMGGAIVQEFALHYPGRLAGIVLVGTGARLRVAPAILDGIRSDFPATARTIADWVHDKNTPEQLKRLYLRSVLENDPQVMYGDFYACDQFDRRADVARIETPALVVCGSNDVMTPPKFSEALAQSLPRARLALIPNAGHMVALEAPEAVAEAVADFLGTLGPFS